MKYLLFSLLLSTTVNADILFVGDSHTVGTFGQSLTRLLEHNNYTVHTAASCGASFRWLSETQCGLWLHTTGQPDIIIDKGTPPSISDLVNYVKPTTTVVALGTNFVGYHDNVSISGTMAIIRLIKEGGSQCVWIGPPDSKHYSHEQLNTVYRVLELATKDQCKLIDSRHYTKYSGTDGIHYTGTKGIKIAEQWATDVYWNELKDSLANSTNGNHSNQ
jgi:hypothetical protein